MANNYYEDELDPSYEPEKLTDYDSSDDCYSDDENGYGTNRVRPLYELVDDEDQKEYVQTSVQYATLQIGIVTLIVSSAGKIRLSNDIFSYSDGYALPGTPYRTYIVEISEGYFEEYYVHDIVWRAFHGDPPDGWEVRHRFWEAKSGKEFYDNSLEALDMYPSKIIYMPSVRKTLPLAN